jgi:tripartite-type tricarboxylate transporter receptor subunit TctC
MRFDWKMVAGGVLAAMSITAAAQGYPNKPVRIVVPFPPGGGVDIIARLVGPILAREYGQQVIVENRAGAAGIIGTEFVARAAPDGYTWAIATLGNLAVNKHLYSTMTVDPLRDLAPVTLHARAETTCDRHGLLEYHCAQLATLDDCQNASDLVHAQASFAHLMQ